MTSLAERRQRFRQLHQSGCFVIPNPWDIGSARILARLGFPALATTSSGFAWSRDGGTTTSRWTRPSPTCRRPLGGGASDQRRLRGRVRRRARGTSRSTSRRQRRPRSPGSRSRTPPATRISRCSTSSLAVERIRAARRALDQSRSGILLVGRSEGFIVGRPDLRETIRRLTAYAEAGADCLYPPGIRSREEISAVVKAVSPKPVNVLVGSDFTTVELASRAGSAADQRGWCARAGGVGRVPPSCQGNR